MDKQLRIVAETKERSSESLHETLNDGVVTFKFSLRPHQCQPFGCVVHAVNVSYCDGRPVSACTCPQSKELSTQHNA
jgi:hypothetical protein